jgi:hypothetical protein
MNKILMIYYKEAASERQPYYFEALLVSQSNNRI